MKKTFISFALVAMCVCTGCQNKQNADNALDGVDSTTVVENTTEELTSAITSALEAKDEGLLEEALNKVNEQLSNVDEKTGADLLAKIKECLNTNADAIKGLVGGNTVVSSLVDKLNNMTNDELSAVKQLEGAGKEAVEGAVNDVKNAAADNVNEAKGAVDKQIDKVNEAKGAVEKKIEDVKQAPQKTADKLKENTGKAIDGAANAAKKSLGL